MNNTLEILSEGQDPAIKRSMSRRVSALMASVRYLKKQQNEYLLFMEEHGWDMNHFEIVFSMSSFYLIVLGPLASSARGRAGSVWRNVPITWGNDFQFDNQRAQQVRNAHQAFSNIARRIPGGLDTLTGNQASDIVFKLYRAMKYERNY